MVHSLQKIIGVSLVMFVAACSNDQSYKHQVSGNEDYLKAPELKELHAPSGMILPVQTGDFALRKVAVADGSLGLALDIRPPSQPLALMSGSRVQYANNIASISLENNAQNQALWSQVIAVLGQNNYKIADRQDANQTLTTDWVNWAREDENVPHQARYQISVQSQGYQNQLSVKVIELKANDKTISDAASIQRYSISMLNSITEALDKTQSNQDASRIAQTTGSVVLQAGRDDTGLPVVIVRAPYANVWERLPGVLESMGMKVEDRNRPQGLITMTFKSSASNWAALNVPDPDLQNGDYKLQVGDLDNRSSLQFSDGKGQVLKDAQNNALVAILQSAFNRTTTK
ncbi:outer membrane protein assembly factor BamC [Budvicia diplopodorum]|uniref:outer membrane protein assembly factor BamC n=1 Tax=Budvicia diplopodorum TaxID=1119056 RepID=UPI001356E6E2|nr:outer membrane protein assembly factor BamC [Budvicia diplopodorum]